MNSRAFCMSSSMFWQRWLRVTLSCNSSQRRSIRFASGQYGGKRRSSIRPFRASTQHPIRADLGVEVNVDFVLALAHFVCS